MLPATWTAGAPITWVPPAVMGKKSAVCWSFVGWVSQRPAPGSEGEQPASSATASRAWTGRSMSAWTSPFPRALDDVDRRWEV